jgi:hypothetical protein
MLRTPSIRRTAEPNVWLQTQLQELVNHLSKAVTNAAMQPVSGLRSHQKIVSKQIVVVC